MKCHECGSDRHLIGTCPQRRGGKGSSHYAEPRQFDNYTDLYPVIPEPTTTKRAARNTSTRSLANYYGQHWSHEEGNEETTFNPFNLHIEELEEEEEEEEYLTRTPTIAGSQRKEDMQSGFEGRSDAPMSSGFEGRSDAPMFEENNNGSIVAPWSTSNTNDVVYDFCSN